MAESTEAKKPAKVGDARVHMANERTFLAWIRTSIGIMAFGFVVEKFALFMKKLALFLWKTGYSGSYSSIFGIFHNLWHRSGGVGALMGLLAFIHYKKTERQIDDDTYRPSIILDILVAMGILAIGVFLVFYMLHSVKG